MKHYFGNGRVCSRLTILYQIGISISFFILSQTSLMEYAHSVGCAGSPCSTTRETTIGATCIGPPAPRCASGGTSQQTGSCLWGATNTLYPIYQCVKLTNTNHSPLSSSASSTTSTSQNSNQKPQATVGVVTGPTTNKKNFTNAGAGVASAMQDLSRIPRPTDAPGGPKATAPASVTGNSQNRDRLLPVANQLAKDMKNLASIPVPDSPDSQPNRRPTGDSSIGSPGGGGGGGGTPPPIPPKPSIGGNSGPPAGGGGGGGTPPPIPPKPLIGGNSGPPAGGGGGGGGTPPPIPPKPSIGGNSGPPAGGGGGGGGTPPPIPPKPSIGGNSGPAGGGGRIVPTVPPKPLIGGAAAGGPNPAAGGAGAAGTTGSQRTGKNQYYPEITAQDACRVSAQIDGGKGCNTTVRIGQAAMTSNMITQATGSMVASTIGQGAQMRAMSSGTQTGALEAAATTQDVTGNTQVSIGALNAALGAIQLYQAQKHNRFGNEFQRDSSGSNVITATDSNAAGNTYTSGQIQLSSNGNSTAEKVISKFGMDEFTQNQQFSGDANSRKSEVEAHQREMNSSFRKITSEAASEQQGASANAMGGAMMSLLTGGQQLFAGTAAKMGAAALRNQAKALKTGAGNYAGFQPVGLPDNAAGAKTAENPPAITGNGETASATTDDQTSEFEAPNLGQGFNPGLLPQDVSGAPPAGQFRPGEGGGGTGGGAGGGMGSGGTTAPATGGGEEAGAKPAPDGGENTQYSSGGTFTGGGRGGGKGPDGGPDLSSMLASLLPKPNEEKEQYRGGIQFAGSGPEDSGLVYGANTNIFSKIHDNYQELNKRGRVGQ